MENAGARKISASEHREEVSLLILKHAAEEHRHAYYLKKQLSKLDAGACKNYHSDSLLAARYTRFYLHVLDIQVCRYLKAHFQLESEALKFAAYLFVTYIIEVRADELYPVYQEVLSENQQKVTVKSIILEEEGHLEEMIHQLDTFSPDWRQHAAVLVALEQQLFADWMQHIELEIREAV